MAEEVLREIFIIINKLKMKDVLKSKTYFYKQKN
jgi:hypothetical protein